jgi:hypothetical protein
MTVVVGVLKGDFTLAGMLAGNGAFCQVIVEVISHRPG